MFGQVLLFSHKQPDFLGQCLLSTGWKIRPDAVLRASIEFLIGTEFREIRREIKNRDFLFVFFPPSLSGLAMMDTQVIQNQKHLAVSTLDQTKHEPDQDLRRHIYAVPHEPHFARVGD